MKITEETKIEDLIPKGWKYLRIKVLTDEDSDYPSMDKFGLIEIHIKKKFKTIDDYENKLMATSCPGVYEILKGLHPKQYYSIILEIIAEDICDKNKERTWIIEDEETLINWGITPFINVTKFDLEEHAQQAIEIMGDKLKFLI